MPDYNELSEGDSAPDFTLPDQNGEPHTLSSLHGEWVILYFYPKDDTPGCTVEAIDFSARRNEFEDNGAVIYGCSPDDKDSHCKFIGKKDLTIDLLSDNDHEVAEEFGVWREKNMYGRKYMGIHRSTFIINPEGKIAKTWYGVKPKDHAQEVLNTLISLRS